MIIINFARALKRPRPSAGIIASAVEIYNPTAHTRSRCEKLHLFTKQRRPELAMIPTLREHRVAE